MMLFGVTGLLGLSPEPDGFATRRTLTATGSRRWV